MLVEEHWDASMAMLVVVSVSSADAALRVASPVVRWNTSVAALLSPVVRWDTSVAMLVEGRWGASMAMLVVEGVSSVDVRA